MKLSPGSRHHMKTVREWHLTCEYHRQPGWRACLNEWPERASRDRSGEKILLTSRSNGSSSCSALPRPSGCVPSSARTTCGCTSRSGPAWRRRCASPTSATTASSCAMTRLRLFRLLGRRPSARHGGDRRRSGDPALVAAYRPLPGTVAGPGDGRQLVRPGPGVAPERARAGAVTAVPVHQPSIGGGHGWIRSTRTGAGLRSSGISNTAPWRPGMCCTARPAVRS
jgi:hypothetical protein